jgi:hypothetical protein
MTSYLALTAHWISPDGLRGHLDLRSALIGFKCMKKKHTGDNIGRTIMHLLDRAGVTAKVYPPYTLYSVAHIPNSLF